jgi:tRNA(fMet)-specific endonuclease VapC
MFVLDTNTLIYHFRGHERITREIECLETDRLLLSVVVLYELQVGLEKAVYPLRRVAQLQEVLSRMTLVEFDTAAARSAAQIRAYLESQGTPIGAIDTLIAGVALSLDATLVTHNTREFSRVPNLNIVDWF